MTCLDSQRIVQVKCLSLEFCNIATIEYSGLRDQCTKYTIVITTYYGDNQ